MTEVCPQDVGLTKRMVGGFIIVAEDQTNFLMKHTQELSFVNKFAYICIKSWICKMSVKQSTNLDT